MAIDKPTAAVTPVKLLSVALHHLFVLLYSGLQGSQTTFGSVVGARVVDVVLDETVVVVVVVVAF